jgi:outer membrane cobalamin receptor
LHTQFSSSFGSSHYSAVEATGSGGWEGGSAAAGVRRERGKGDYEFEFSDGLTTTNARRSGNDFTLASAYLNAREEIGEDASVTLFGFYTNADRGSPGPMTDPEQDGKARLDDELTRLQSGFAWSVSHDVQLRATVSWQYQDEHYDDPGVLLGGVPLSSRYLNRSYSISPEVRYIPSQTVAVTGGFEYAYAGLESDDVHDAQRWQRSVFASSQITLPLPFALPYEVLLFPLIRYDAFTDVDGDVSPKLGLNIGVLRDPDLRIRATYGKSYRVPTFNDLYWKVGGNPDLTPERSLSFDAGLVVATKLYGMVSAGLTYFAIDTHDRILWLPASGTISSPRNIARTASRGIEAELQWRGLDGLLTLSCNSTWTKATKESEDYPGDPTMGKELIYVPRQTFNVSMTINADPVTAVVDHLWTSYRYTTEFNDRFLPASGVTSLAVKYRMPFSDPGLWVNVEVTNLFNVSYQSIALYPMPLREFRATVGVEL